MASGKWRPFCLGLSVLNELVLSLRGKCYANKISKFVLFTETFQVSENIFKFVYFLHNCIILGTQLTWA